MCVLQKCFPCSCCHGGATPADMPQRHFTRIGTAARILCVTLIVDGVTMPVQALFWAINKESVE
jgi:hypothetical protein